MWAALWQLLVCLPEILRLITKLQEQSTDRKVKSDFKKISEAFDKGDSAALNDIFRK